MANTKTIEWNKVWKQFVVTLCKAGATNTSSEIATFINQNGGNVTSAQVAAVKANFSRGSY